MNYSRYLIPNGIHRHDGARMIRDQGHFRAEHQAWEFIGSI